MSDSGFSNGPRHHPALWGLRIAGFVVLGVIGAAVFALVFGWFVMLLWNWLMPVIFHLGEITFWQAFGIIILAKLIFGTMGLGGRHGHGRKHGPWGKHGPWNEGWEGGKDRWRYYREFWDQEGKKAFNDFVERRKGGGETPPDGQKG
jgi:hypothetical protein